LWFEVTCGSTGTALKLTGVALSALFGITVSKSAPWPPGQMAVGVGIARPTTQKDLIATSSGFHTTLLWPVNRESDGTSLGLTAGIVPYRTGGNDLGGSHFFAMGVLHWTMLDGLLPAGSRLFGQLGIGYGRMEITGSAAVEIKPAKTGVATLGLELPVTSHVGVWVTTTLQRFDAAPVLLGNDYVSWNLITVHGVCRWNISRNTSAHPNRRTPR
jgi:hypothetical protein